MAQSKDMVVSGKNVICFDDGRVYVEAPRFSAGSGYIYCRINKQNFAVHRLIAEAFHGTPADDQEINHKDRNKINNNKDNLEWVSHQENMSHYSGIIRKKKLMVKNANHYRNLLWEQYQDYFSIETGLLETAGILDG